jgi:hypothetical protein
MQVGSFQKAFYFSQPAKQRGQRFMLVAALLSKPSDLIAEPADLGRQCSRPTVGHAALSARPDPRPAVGETQS